MFDRFRKSARLKVQRAVAEVVRDSDRQSRIEQENRHDQLLAELAANNGEMKRLMLTHAFRFVDRVLFRVGPKNIRSQRALEKIGAVLRGTEREPTGREIVVFVIDREAFESGPLGAASASMRNG